MKKLWFVRNTDILFVFVAATFCNFISLPEIVKAFLALPAFLIIPYRLGNVFAIATSKFAKNITFDPVSKFILLWAVGTISLLLLAILLNALGMFNVAAYVLSILAMMFISILFNTIRGHHEEKPSTFSRKSIRNVCGDYSVVLILLIIALYPLAYFMSFTDFPLTIGIDTFNFILSANQIVQDNYLEVFPHWISIYPPTLPLFLAVNSLLFNVSVLSLCWTLPFLFYPLFSLGIYLFSYQLSKRWKISFIAAIIGVASTGFSKWVFINSLYYIIPKNIVYLIFPFLLFLVQKNIDPGGSDTGKKTLSIVLSMITSTLIFSVFSLSFSSAPHHFPHTYVVGIVILLSFLFTILTLESAGRKRLEVKFLILVSSMTIAFLLYSMLTLLPLSEQEIPHIKIFLGITAAVLMLPFLLIEEFRKKIVPRYFLLFCVVSLISFLFHFFMGLILVFLIYFYTLSRLITEKAPLMAMVILGGIIGLSSLLIIFQQYDMISLTQINDAVPSMFRAGREFDLPQRNEMLINTFHGVVIMLSILGTVMLFAREKFGALPVACLFSLILFMYFLPIPGTYRFMTFVTPLLTFLAANALFIYGIKLSLPSRIRIRRKIFPVAKKFLRVGFKKEVLKGLYVLMVSFFFVPFIAQPHIMTVSVLTWRPYFSPSTINFDNIEAASWISQNTPKDTIVISEPNTQIIIAALANREEGSFFPGDRSIDLKTIFTTTNASEAHLLILQYRQLRIEYDEVRANLGSRFLQGNRPVIVVIDGRVSVMIENSNAESGPNVPVAFKPFDGFYKFYDSSYFTLLHNVNDEIYIFAVKIVGTTYSG